MRKFLLALLGILLFGAASAQTLTDPGSWHLYATNPAAFIGAIIVVTEFLKSHVLGKYITKKWETIGLAFVLSVAGQFLMWIPGWVPHNALVTLVVALFYGGAAAGFAKFVSGIFKNSVSGPLADRALTAVVGKDEAKTIETAMEDASSAPQAGSAANPTPPSSTTSAG